MALSKNALVEATFKLDEKVQVMWGGTWHPAKIEAIGEGICPGKKHVKVPSYKVHYFGWNKRWDEWVFANAITSNSANRGQTVKHIRSSAGRKSKCNPTPKAQTPASSVVSSDLADATDEGLVQVEENSELPESANQRAVYPDQLSTIAEPIRTFSLGDCVPVQGFDNLLPLQTHGEVPQKEKPPKRKPHMEKKRKDWVIESFKWCATTDMYSSEIVRMFERWCDSEGLSVKDDHGLKDPMNSISRLMESTVRGKKGRNNGKSKGDYGRRKPQCGFTEPGEQLYRKLFPEYSDLKKIIRSVPKRKPRQLVSANDDTVVSASDSE